MSADDGDGSVAMTEYEWLNWQLVKAQKIIRLLEAQSANHVGSWGEK